MYKHQEKWEYKLKCIAVLYGQVGLKEKDKGGRPRDKKERERGFERRMTSVIVKTLAAAEFHSTARLFNPRRWAWMS